MKEAGFMANCPLIEDCVFFNDEMLDKPNLVSKSFKQRFCQSSNANCARWRVYGALGSEFIPRDLYPNQEDKVNDILEGHKKYE
jgi:hypothetical protein